MSEIPINIAVEDLLSEAVARRLLLHSGRAYAVGAVYGRGGNGYLKKTVNGWNNAAKSIPFLLLTDLDDAKCPTDLINSWLPSGSHQNLIFRVAVTEVESWLLADKINFAGFLGVSKANIPDAPDQLSDPKATLIAAAAKSPHSVIKGSIVPKPRSSSKQGRDYNGCLIDFVTNLWNPSEAASRSPSLMRCVTRLAAFLPTWP